MDFSRVCLHAAWELKDVGERWTLGSRDGDVSVCFAINWWRFTRKCWTSKKFTCKYSTSSRFTSKWCNSYSFTRKFCTCKKSTRKCCTSYKFTEISSSKYLQTVSLPSQTFLDIPHSCFGDMIKQHTKSDRIFFMCRLRQRGREKATIEPWKRQKNSGWNDKRTIWKLYWFSISHIMLYKFQITAYNTCNVWLSSSPSFLIKAKVSEIFLLDLLRLSGEKERKGKWASESPKRNMCVHTWDWRNMDNTSW